MVELSLWVGDSGDSCWSSIFYFSMAFRVVWFGIFVDCVSDALWVGLLMLYKPLSGSLFKSSSSGC